MDRIALDEAQIERIRRRRGHGFAASRAWRAAFRPMFRMVAGPPQSGFSGLGRTEISGAGAEMRQDRRRNRTVRPPAMARTVAAGSATVRGTGRSSRTSRCRHFARQPWRGRADRAPWG